MNKLGFIGVGDLADYTIKGLRNGDYQGQIHLSPRNQQRVQTLAAECNCEVMPSNQAVADASDIIVLSTRPADCHQALSELKLRPEHLIISVVAGVSIESLQKVIAPNIQIIRAMPVNCAEAGASPTLIFPDNHTVRALFDHCGKAISVAEEAAFGYGSVLAAMQASFFQLFEEIIKEMSGNTLSRELATDLVLGMTQGAAALAQYDKSNTPGDIASRVATEGTFSKLGLDVLKDQNAFEPWHEVCQRLIKRMV